MNQSFFEKPIVFKKSQEDCKNKTMAIPDIFYDNNSVARNHKRSVWNDVRDGQLGIKACGPNELAVDIGAHQR